LKKRAFLKEPVDLSKFCPHSPSAPPPSFPQSPYPPCSLVRDELTHPHRPRLVVYHSTCRPLSSPPREQLCNRSCSNKQTHAIARHKLRASNYVQVRRNSGRQPSNQLRGAQGASAHACSTGLSTGRRLMPMTARCGAAALCRGATTVRVAAHGRTPLSWCHANLHSGKMHKASEGVCGAKPHDFCYFFYFFPVKIT